MPKPQLKFNSAALFKARIDAGETLESLASKVDVHFSTLSRWESGESSPRSPADVKDVAKVLKIKTSDLWEEAEANGA